MDPGGCKIAHVMIHVSRISNIQTKLARFYRTPDLLGRCYNSTCLVVYYEAKSTSTQCPLGVITVFPLKYFFFRIAGSMSSAEELDEML